MNSETREHGGLVISIFVLSSALAEAAGGEHSKSGSQNISEKAVENGNQGLTQEEIIQMNLAEFIRKKTGGRADKTRYT